MLLSPAVCTQAEITEADVGAPEVVGADRVVVVGQALQPSLSRSRSDASYAASSCVMMLLAFCFSGWGSARTSLYHGTCYASGEGLPSLGAFVMICAGVTTGEHH